MTDKLTDDIDLANELEKIDIKQNTKSGWKDEKLYSSLQWLRLLKWAIHDHRIAETFNLDTLDNDIQALEDAIKDDCVVLPKPKAADGVDLNKLVSDDQINNAWGNANFGADADKRGVILDTLKKVACHFGTGHTALTICMELKLIKGYQTTRGASLTTLGGRYLWEAEFAKNYNIARKLG